MNSNPDIKKTGNMNNTRKFTRAVTSTVGLTLLGCVLATNVLADNYRVKIKSIRPESATGDIIIQVKPGTNEKNFSGKARVMLVGSDPGTNRALAAMLTAVSLKAEVVINVINPPSYADIQAIISSSLIAP